MISIDSAKCTKCGFCIDECPNYVFALISVAGGDTEIKVRYPEQCCICAHCVAICPETAINHDEMPAEKFEDLPGTRIPPEHIKNLLLSRRSIRAFKEKPVTKEVVGQLIETGVHAGSSSNGQTENFIIIQDRKVLAELEQIVVEVLWKAGLKYLGSSIGCKLAKMKLGDEMVRQFIPYHHIIKNRKKNNQLEGMVFRNAPVVIVSHGLRTNFMAHANCAIAARNMEIMARTMGLGTCWVGFLSTAANHSKKIGRYIGIPDDHNIYSAIMVGYPKHEYKKKIPRKDREVRWMWNLKK
jgi:nitroreductase/NAD-dependent dihydropyrimidine dehydrogenase PreA subunit